MSPTEQAVKDSHGFLQLRASGESTHLIAVAVCRDVTKNTVTRICCKRGLPIGGYTYDAEGETYHVECAEFVLLGRVPLALVATMTGDPAWHARVPLPDAVVRKQLTLAQRSELRKFRSLYKSPQFAIRFMQIVDPN